MKQKCIHCDGLGYFYNQATFQSEHCPHCDGKGYIEINHDLGGPVVAKPENPIAINTTTSVHNDEPVVEAPKSKKSTKPVEPVIEPIVEEPTEPTVDNGGDVDGSK